MSGRKQKRNLVSAEVASLLLQNNLSRGTIKYLSESISHTIVTLAEMNIQGYAGVDMYQMSRENYGGSEATGRYDVNRHGVKSLGHFFDDIKSLKTVSKDVESKARCLRWLGFHMLYAYTAIHIFGEERDREALLGELFQHDFDYDSNPIAHGENTISLFRVMMERDSDDVYKKLPPTLSPYDKANLSRKVIQLIESEEEICALRYKLETKQFKSSDNTPYSGSSVRTRRLEGEGARGVEGPREERVASSSSSSDHGKTVSSPAPGSTNKKDNHLSSVKPHIDNLNHLYEFAQSAELSIRIRDSLSSFLDDHFTSKKQRKLNHHYHMDLQGSDQGSSRLMTTKLKKLFQEYASEHPNLTLVKYSTLLMEADTNDDLDLEAEYEDFHLNFNPNMDPDDLLSLALFKLQQGNLLMCKSFSI